MSRAVIGGVVAVVIAALTAAAYFVTTSSLEDRIRKDVKRRVARSQSLLDQTAKLEALGLQKRAEALASDPQFSQALTGESGPDPALAERGFKRFRAKIPAGDALPDVLALTDKQGLIVALLSGDKEVVNPIKDQYIKDGKLKYQAIELALASVANKRQIISEIWDYETIGPMKAAVAPIVDIDMGETVGAVIVAYSISADEASRQRDLLGTEVAYFYNQSVYATSFGGSKDSDKRSALQSPLFEGGLARQALDSKEGFADLVTIELDGEEYIATAGRLPRFSTQGFPPNYAGMTAGTMVAMSVNESLAPLSTVKMAILLVGIGVLIIALLGMFVTAKRLLGPLDEIEVGINEIINGNIDRTFRPVGSDLDGLANALNVMLARLLGRPEPGEEEYDEDGNIVQPGALSFDTEGLSPKDQEAVKLAQEPEDSYYRRIYDEYVAAKRDTGESVEGVSFESFVAKLRLNEANLRTKYESRAVRFKVVTNDGKVTLKPVPIA